MEIDMGHETHRTSSSDGYLTPHLLRHITRIQVRNFTPFPARDALASALTQPSEQSQFTSYGSLSDDLDVALARKRSRRTSSSSVITVKSQGLDSHTNEESRAVGFVPPPELKARKRTVSRVSARESPTSFGSGSHPPLSGAGTVPRVTRPRTSSITSSISGKGMPPTATHWQQKTLEKVLRSRLVETFITVTVPSSLEYARGLAKHSTPVSSPAPARRPNSRESPASNRKLHSPQSSQSRSVSGSTEEQLLKRASRTSTAISTDELAPAPISSNRKVVVSPSKLNGNGNPPKSKPQVSQVRADPEIRTVPNFISAIHNPSTNPDFALEINDFSNWTDPSATYMAVQLWARLHPNVVGKEKGKEKMSGEVDVIDWRIAGKWDICLTNLVPLPDEIAMRLSTLPSNTLLLTLSPPGKTFYLPVASSLEPTRSPSPSSGYNSDPEVHISGTLLASGSAMPRRKDISLPRTKVRQSRAEYATTSSWPDLVKLVNLQCAIIDKQESLSKIIQTVDALFAPPDASWLIRDISEREAKVADWRAAEDQVIVETETLLERIRQRKEELKRRREVLTLARVMLSEDIAAEAFTEQELSRARSSVVDLQRRIRPIRVTVISTLTSLFPIDLISGSDLLFGILNVPLPIPLGATDPAPPLSLPTYKEVNEESVATALAYAALVVQLLAMYLGKMLVYPITFAEAGV
ncbi:hypothetical protein B0F90DRAFT_17268 [Multifurca ochricompacta]|uniref:Uncharacterized protein n=1 Tax=Multifurca ochricompacta TaxID=376703 RepID=A0AAD4QT51_9AGAM|nr:hypothetical protein B0F90DRAFT_17268 [Multifurca ochricompacta]